jgi:anthranilate phosphoribosyltransferase
MIPLIEQLHSGQNLSSMEIGRAAADLLDESVPEEEKAGFLRALSDKGETAAEIAGFVEAFLERAVVPELDGMRAIRPLLDVCGTGGDRLDLFNVSTASVFILAAAGVAVVKHGNRGITSRSGGADVLEALGIRIDLPPEAVGDCLQEVGAAFLFAPRYHPAFKSVAGVRRQLAAEGRRTIFNLLGPLLNPARPEYQLLGVFDGSLARTFADILRRLGRRRAWAVYGRTDAGAGMDELSSIGSNTVWETRLGSEPESLGIDPESLGFSPGGVDGLKGGDAAANAELLRGLFGGRICGPKRDTVLLNAAAGLVICGISSDLRSGIDRAAEAIDSGQAASVLEAWRRFSPLGA